MKRVVLFSLALTLVVAACSDQSNPAQPDTEPQMAVVPVSVAAAPAISTLTITVSASDIASDLVFNVTMTNGEATDTITIPAGSGRTITVRGYDASNIETHRGSKTVNLTEGVNPQLTVVLEGLTGDQPLVVALGETTVTVSPETATASVGGTTQLAAVVTDEAGDTLAVSVRWASSHPAVATVDDAGLVSGVSTGTASIIATYGGVGASAAVTVSDAVFPTEGLVAWYPFNGNANDESGNGYDGTVVEATFTTRGSESALSFEANADDYVTVPNFTETFAEGFTASVWARTVFESSTGQFFHRRTFNNIDFAVEPVYFAALNTTLFSRDTLPGDPWHHAPGDWHHYTFTYDGSSMRMYMDGDLVAASAIAGGISNNTNTLVFAKYAYSSTTQYFNGALDDVGFWNRALTPEEIAYLAGDGAVAPQLGVGFGLEQFSLIEAGSFEMGSSTGSADEQPVHTVNITQPFYIQRTEVTQSQWQAVMGSNPSLFTSCGEECPVERVNWNDIQAFLDALNSQDPGKNYRLPTEAEWEYAARAGTGGDFAGTGVLDEMGWHSGNSGETTHPVAQKQPVESCDCDGR